MKQRATEAPLGDSLQSTAPHSSQNPIWGFPEIRGTSLGVPIIRTIVFWGPYWGPLI